MVWWILPIAVAFFGLSVVFSGFLTVKKLTFANRVARLLGGGMALGFAGVLSLTGLNLQSYSRLTHEEPVAYIELAELHPQHYTARIRFEGEGTARDFEVFGDEIIFQARVIKWEPWANIIGYDAIYRLDRMSGQYTSIEDERTKERTVYSLRDGQGLDVFQLVRKRGNWINAIDAHYGSGTYVPMLDGSAYQVFMTQNGLITRPANEVAKDGLRNWVISTRSQSAG